MPPVLLLALSALLILPVTVQHIGILKDKLRFALCRAHV